MSAASKKGWTPERRLRQSEAQKKSWAKRGARVRRIDGITKSWTPERRKAQSVTTKRMNADPELNARRIAGLRKSKATPENRKRVSTWSKGLWAKPGHNERISTGMKNTWAELRSARAAQTATAKTRKGRGRPSKSERNRRVVELWDLGGTTWAKIAEEIDPKAYAENRKNAADKMRDAYDSGKRSKEQETPA